MAWITRRQYLPKAVLRIRFSVRILSGRLKFVQSSWRDREIHLEQLTPQLMIFGNLAYSHFYKGDFEQAVALYSEVLQLRQRILGNEHPDTLDAMSKLAFSYQRLKQFDKALPLAEESRATCLRVMGPTHVTAILATDRLADAYEGLGKIEESIELRELAINNRLARQSELYKFCMSVEFLIRRYGMFGYHDRCATLGRKFIESIESNYGAEHKSTVFAMNWTSFSLCVRPGADAATIKIALKYAERACELSPQSSGHWLSLGMAQYRSGKWEEALNALHEHRELRPEENPIAKLFRAMTFWQLQRKDEARQQLLGAKEELEAKKTGRMVNFVSEEACSLITNGNEGSGLKSG